MEKHKKSHRIFHDFKNIDKSNCFKSNVTKTFTFKTETKQFRYSIYFFFSMRVKNVKSQNLK